MKKVIKNIFILVILVCLPVFISSIYADQPPDPGGGPGGGDPVGGGSPLINGNFLLLILGAAYGTRKFFISRKKLMD